MIVVTGGAGFIGSNLVRGLNEQGHDDILVVDDLSDSSKIRNLGDCVFADYMDKDEYLERVERDAAGTPRIIFHQGACSDTRETDGRYMMETNYSYSKTLLHYAMDNRASFIYASSASVYGAGTSFAETPGNEAALNVYAFSKLQFDRYARRAAAGAESQVVGLRYFNVYGPRESHKGGMASVAFHFFHQYRETGKARLFVGSGGYGDGAQERDFLWVGDAVKVNLHFKARPETSGVFNVGTGTGRSFNQVALAVINAYDRSSLTLQDALEAGQIEYIPFPDGLRDKYQSYTRADIQKLVDTGYAEGFTGIEEGIERYVDELRNADDA